MNAKAEVERTKQWGKGKWTSDGDGRGAQVQSPEFQVQSLRHLWIVLSGRWRNLCNLRNLWMVLSGGSIPVFGPVAVIDSSLALADEPRRTASLGRGGPGVLASTKPGWSTELPSIESVVIDGRRRIVYTGPSMNPTLREPDLLWVEPYGNCPVRAGDVVCYKSPEENVNIVHRVIFVGPRSPVSGRLADGIRTQGDNNPWPDIGVLATDDLLGQVVAAQRGRRLRPIPGGWIGRVVAWSVKLRKAIWRVFAGALSGTYQGLVRSGPFDFLLPGGLRPRPVCFNGRGAATLKLLMGRQTVGQYDYRLKQWHVRPPFRLFVDEQTLPNLKSKIQNPKSE